MNFTASISAGNVCESTGATGSWPLETDMRLADCGGTTLPGWQLGWAQVIGSRHPRFSEDSLAHSNRLQSGQVLGSPHALCLAVADGVGGGARGEVASAALANHSVALPDELMGHPGAIARWMNLAEGQVQLKLREVSYAPGAATLAAAWLMPNTPYARSGEAESASITGYILRVGDARLYQFDGCNLTPLTSDQTYKNVGEAPPEGATPDDPARMVGTGFMGKPEILPLQMGLGQTLLLCSDGLHRSLSAEKMADLLRQGGDFSTCALRLAKAARLAGSDDDITVLLAGTIQSLSHHSLEPRGLVNMLRKIF